MTEQEWLSSTDPREMLQFIERNVSDRKLRLFACACCRRVWDEILDPISREIVEVSERYADGVVSDEKMTRVTNTTKIVDMAALHSASYPARQCARDTAWYAARKDARKGALNAADAMQAQIFRDIVGNPFKQTASQAHWKTRSVLQLAQAIYDDRQFDLMPILGDALEEAGCESEDLLKHCRSGDVHVRGCWAVDLILGKE